MAMDGSKAGQINQNLRQTVCESIRSYIFDNQLQPGTKLPSETEFASILDVSRTSLREGIRMLEGAGFIECKQGDGMYVAEYNGERLLDYIQYSIRFNKEEIKDIYDVRNCLEVCFVKEACCKLTEDQLTRLKGIVEQMNNCEPLEYHWLDRDFHLTLFENISNRLARHIMELYWDVVLCRWLPYEAPRIPDTNVENHKTIIRALETGNSDAAYASMVIHMAETNTI